MDNLPVDVPGRLLFWGIGGSHGFGLAEASSDIDYKGVYVAPTESFFRFDKPKEGICVHDLADVELDEIEKFLKLVCKGNHHHLEFLYFEPQYIGNVKMYNELQRLVPHIVPKDAYYNCVKGMAAPIRRNLDNINMGDYHAAQSIDWKQIMHMIRIVTSGIDFLKTKNFTVKVNPNDVDMFLSIKHGEVSPIQVLRLLDKLLRALTNAYHNSPMKPQGNILKAEQMLNKIRRHHEFYRV